MDCSCVHRFGINYDTNQCLISDQQGPIFECNSECQCSLNTCHNRVSQQNDQSDNVKIISTPTTGYGVVLKTALPHPGTFVGEYIGEVLSETDAHQRIQSTKDFEDNYLLLYNEHQSNSVTKTFIDARYYGNWTRFINHSCNPNLHIVPIRIDQPEPPRLVFFTLRAIEANEELSYSYGSTIDTHSSKPCRCLSSSCTGYMPYQLTD